MTPTPTTVELRGLDVCPCGSTYAYHRDPDPVIHAHWWAAHFPHYAAEEATAS